MAKCCFLPPQEWVLLCMVGARSSPLVGSKGRAHDGGWGRSPQIQGFLAPYTFPSFSLKYPCILEVGGEDDSFLTISFDEEYDWIQAERYGLTPTAQDTNKCNLIIMSLLRSDSEDPQMQTCLIQTAVVAKDAADDV
eukprot:scaffold3054_cov129-Cylindrotheca_fusiformis.AAC.3